MSSDFASKVVFQKDSGTTNRIRPIVQKLLLLMLKHTINLVYFAWYWQFKNCRAVILCLRMCRSNCAYICRNEPVLLVSLQFILWISTLRRPRISLNKHSAETKKSLKVRFTSFTECNNSCLSRCFLHFRFADLLHKKSAFQILCIKYILPCTIIQ